MISYSHKIIVEFIIHGNLEMGYSLFGPTSFSCTTISKILSIVHTNHIPLRPGLNISPDFDVNTYTICPRSSNPFYIVTYYIKWVTTSWTLSISCVNFCVISFKSFGHWRRMPGAGAEVSGKIVLIVYTLNVRADSKKT